MEVYGGIPVNGSSMSNGSTSGNTTTTGGGGGNQFMPNKYQFATYYGQKSMLNNVGGGAGSHFGQGGN
jgi:hypothetical protein